MEYLIAIYTGRKIYTLHLKPGITATVGDTQNDTVYVEKYSLGPSYLVLACDAGGVRILSRQPVKFGDESVSNRVLSAGEVITVTEKISLAVFPAKCALNSAINLQGTDELRIGRSYNNNDICLKDANVSTRHAVLKRVNGQWKVSDLQSRNGTFVNGTLAAPDEEIAAENVNVFICGYVFYVQNDMLRFTNIPGEIEFAPEIVDVLVPMPARQKTYPFFQRSPRIRNKPEKSEFEIAAPPSTGTKPTISWLSVMIQPIMMVGVMFLVSMVMKNYSMLLYSVPMSLVSLLVTVINHKTSMKQWMKTNDLAIEKYSEYLEETERNITAAEGAYISSLSAANPGVIECMEIARNVSRRLWERTTKDTDFLNLRLGTGSSDSNVSIKLPNTQISIEDDPFIKRSKAIRDSHQTLTGIPVCHSLLEYPVTGLVGRRDAVLRTAWRLIMDIAVHHSSDDVRILCVYPEEERAQWEWLRWLPHIWYENRKRRYLASTKEEARLMLRDAAETLKARRRESSGSGRDKPLKLPFYVLILADRALTEYSGEPIFPENSSLGLAAVYAYGDMRELPGECQSVITCDFPAKIQNTEPGKGTTNITFTPDRLSLSQLDAFARALAPVHLVSSGGSKMPSSVTFLQGLSANFIDELNILDKWKAAQSFKSLAVPMGIRENGDVFKFDILDKAKNPQAMGPHGMTLGTAGSGKSETLTTLLLSMAASYSPEDVNFALIEFKGNDLSNILKPLPHVAGVIGNLNDTSTIIRGLRSLEGEIKRRQRIFEATPIPNKDLPTYQEYQKTHEDMNLDPLPYLIIVIDEFAEFITQFPEYNDQIISIAQVGRSLGMYMILTMQSPQGVIKGRVEANITFRICMRTANASESKEILGTDDAFKLSAPGRTIVKVGTNIYEHIQTFYAKAPYRPSSGQKNTVEEINLVNLNGMRQKPKIYGRTVEAIKSSEKTQGQMVVKSIIDTVEANHIIHARPVWTDPLPEMFALNELTDGQEAFDRTANTWDQKNDGLAVTVGRVDAPMEQRQYPFVLDFMTDGHQILYGAPSTGKTSFLQTVLTSAALLYTPEQVNFVILDYGSFILKTFEVLPHTLIAADPTDEEKVKKATLFIKNELGKRRKLFSAEGVANLEAYREAIGKPVPAIIVAIDNISSLSNQSPDLLEVINLAARDGGGLGIYLMITTGNNGGFMYKIVPYVKSNHTLQMTDRTEYRMLVGGDGKMDPGHYPGRGLTKGALEFQTALCVEGAGENERNRTLKALCQAMSEAWTGERASIEEAEAAASAPVEAGDLSFSEDSVQIGLTKDNRSPVDFVYKDMNGCIISGTDGGGKSSILGMIAKALNDDPKTKLYVYESKPFIEKFCPNAIMMHTPAEVDTIIAPLEEAFDHRDEDSEGRIVLCLDNFTEMYDEITEDSGKILSAIAGRGADKGMYVYVACSQQGAARFVYDESLKNLANSGNAIIAGGDLDDYEVLKKFHREVDTFFGAHEGCMMHDSKVTRMLFGKP